MPAKAAVAVAVVGVPVDVLAGGGDQSGGDSGGPLAARATTSTTTSTTTTYQRTPYVPRPEDFVLEVQVLEQKCFGSAGCNVTFRLGVAYNGEFVSTPPGATLTAAVTQVF